MPPFSPPSVHDVPLAGIPETARDRLATDSFATHVRAQAARHVLSEALVVLGNGPSLTNFDLRTLVGVDSVGMNAAMRHWKTIDWFPTYYCCLDTVVVVSLADEIFSLVDDSSKNDIVLFLLQRNILTRWPKLAFHPRVVIYDEWTQSLLFRDNDRVTTGSVAALFGMGLGYPEIYLLGIDCNYIQEIDGSIEVDGPVRAISRTPRTNPNYFFPDYQRAGDRYHLPDSIPSLHVQSWARVREKSEEYGVSVINCNTQSKGREFEFQDGLDLSRDLAHVGAHVLGHDGQSSISGRTNALARLAQRSRRLAAALGSPRRELADQKSAGQTIGDAQGDRDNKGQMA